MNSKRIGMILFFGGIAALIIYYIYLGFNEILQTLDIISGLLTGIIILGFLTLLISIIIEQKNDTRKTMENIKKEDLRP